MAKKYIKNLLARFNSPNRHPYFAFLSQWLKNENLWHINKHSVSGALFIGLFCAMIPFPIQMPLAAVLAIAFKTNFAISVLSTWISNPITFVPLYSATYVFGLWLLNLPMPAVEPDLEALLDNLALVWKPLLVGSLASGIILGSLGYIAVRIYWRALVLRGWRLRKERRRMTKAQLNLTSRPVD